MEKPKFNDFPMLSPLTIQKYERYLPTAFDESMTLLEKSNKIIEFLNHVERLLGNFKTDWETFANYMIDYMETYETNLNERQEVFESNVSESQNSFIQFWESFVQKVYGGVLIWLEPVETVSDLITTYPNAIEGNSAMVNQSPDGFSKVYRFTEGVWKLIQSFDATAINEVENRLNAKVYNNALRLEKQFLDTSTKVPYIAHRGFNAIAPENTLPAYEQAGRFGYWASETDIQLTSDGVWVLMHDETIDRTTDGTGTISTRTLAQVKELNIDSGNKISNYSGTKIPTLEEFLVVCKKWGMIPVIEISPVIAISSANYDNLFAIIKKHGLLGKCIFIAFNIPILQAVRERDKICPIGYNVNTITQQGIDVVKQLGNGFINANVDNVTDALIGLCHNNDVMVGVWTVNTKTQLDKCDLVDFISTDELIGEV